jgi:hypothetical protein
MNKFIVGYQNINGIKIQISFDFNFLFDNNKIKEPIKKIGIPKTKKYGFRQIRNDKIINPIPIFDFIVFSVSN